MDPQYLSLASSLVNTYVVPLAWRMIGALALWIIGGWLIGLLARLAQNAMRVRHVDKTLATYADAAIRVGLKILLIIAILGVFGVETTSLAALLAAAGIAIGTAWSGLLSNLAAGVFLVVLRPFRVGDIVQAGSVTGEVKTIGLFMTALDTGENLRTYVGNSKVLGEIIVNYSTNGYRRVDLRVQLAHGVDPSDAIARLSERIAKIPNVRADPPPQIAIQEFTSTGPVLAVRPFCAAPDYQQVFFNANQAIADVIGEAGYPVPATYQVSLADPSAPPAGLPAPTAPAAPRAG